jgi:Fe-S cluster assembly iron-binding protein IscA
LPIQTGRLLAKEKTIMLTVTEKAQKQMAAFLEGRCVQSVRIMLTDACPGPRLDLGLDRATADDRLFDIAGVTYLVDKELLDRAQTITIDHTEHGWEISSSLELGPQCSGCGTPNSRCGH